MRSAHSCIGDGIVGTDSRERVGGGWSMDDLLVRMEGIDKRFPGVNALDQCRFELRRGEVHALCGENGAGKSTLMKVLAGVYPKDAGRILLKGQEVDIPTPRAAQKLGI